MTDNRPSDQAVVLVITHALSYTLKVLNYCNLLIMNTVTHEVRDFSKRRNKCIILKSLKTPTLLQECDDSVPVKFAHETF